MAITGARLTFVQQVSRNIKFRGRALALEIRGPKGIENRAAEAIKNLPALLAMKDVKVKAYTPLGVKLDVISLVGKTAEEIDVLAAKVDQLSQASAARTPQIELPKMIEHPDLPFRVMKGVVPEKSLEEGRELAGQYGKNFRVPTEQELVRLNKKVGDQLEGKEYWIWTETEHENYPGRFVLRYLDDAGRDFIPERHCGDGAVRLVEDK